MAHTSSSPSKKTQSVKFQGRFETNYNSKEAFELVAKIRRNQEQKIELSIKNRRKKRRNIIQEKMTSKNQAEKNQTKDLKCATHLLCEKFRNMSEEKKTIVRDLGFGGLMHIPPLRVDHKLLKELANSFKLGKNTLETGYGSFRVRQTIIGAALGLNTSDKKGEERHPKPWIANWTREQLVERIKQKWMNIWTQSKKKKVIVEDSSPESEIRTEELDEFLREKNEKSAAQGEKEADLQSTEGHYVSSETIPDVNLGSDDPSFQGHTDQSSVNEPAESMLSLVEESASEPAEENMMVVRVETQSQTEALSITPEPPQKPEESTPMLPPAPSKINPVPEDAAALMMMAQTSSYIPKKGSIPSFSLGLTNSSQEEATTQEGAAMQDGERAKTPETPKLLEQLGDLSFEKFETPARTNENTADMKEKCYIWATRVKTYGNGLTNEYDTVCTLNAQDRYILSKVHLASLAAETHIEAEIVSVMCLILNQQKIKRFQEEVYCLPPDIVSRNMAIANHPEGVFLQPKTNKPFRVEDYPMFIPFLDFKKLASHRYSICWGAPLKRRDKDKEIEPPYINISDQKTSYDCAIYVMKWLEIIQPENIKMLKYEWDNWTQDEVDHFRVEYASRILFHEMNQDKAEAIRRSNAIRLSKPSSLLLSPYCQIDSNDIDTD
ncbi:uncharacterized protein DS421_20g703880 [Arachis hypogaea]|nr:uncharacterized protein DS421_20g703880 [Arachis hypogaea]